MLIGIILIVLAGLFYWFAYRPSVARKACNQVALEKSGQTEAVGVAGTLYDAFYESCLHDRGLK